MSEFSWRETFVQPAFIPLTFVTFEKEFLLLVTSNGIKIRKENERRGDEIGEILSEESLERSRGRRRRENFNGGHRKAERNRATDKTLIYNG